MNSMQKKLFILLSEIDGICSKHNITYYLAAGGALGAIRHDGFLPWDDDIDLYITRDNWEKLKAVIYDELPSNRNFVCEEDTPLYCNSVGRYVDRETTLMMRSQIICGECCGLVVEFFIFDPMPSGQEKKWQHKRYMRAYTELLTPYFVLGKEIFEHNKEYDYKLCRRYYLLGKIIGRQRSLNILKHKFACFDEKTADEFCMRWGQKTIVFNARYFGMPDMAIFEGKAFPIVPHTREYFREGYGDDWMMVPESVDKRSHNLDCDMNRPYAEYVNMYMPLIDVPKTLKSYKHRKKIIMKNLEIKERYNKSIAMTEACCCGSLINQEGYDSEVIEEYIKEQQYGKLNEFFSYFYEKQFSYSIKANDISIPVDDRYLYYATMNLLLQGKYYMAQKLLSYRKKEMGGILTGVLGEVENKIKFCRELSIAVFDMENPEEVKHILERNKEYSCIVDYAKAQLWVDCFFANTEDDYKNLVIDADSYVKQFWNDGEILRFKAFGLFKLGNKEEARKEYMQAVNNTRNGFVWKEAKLLFGIEPEGEEYEEQRRNIDRFTTDIK